MAKRYEPLDCCGAKYKMTVGAREFHQFGAPETNA
ncbi:MAG: hypothetical protein ACJAU6_004004 [Alphaproteobacteria bacterium]|jgi:hypothetical protein